MPRHTVIIGADETGRLLAEKLVTAGETVSVVDNNPENCAAAKKLKGASVYCEDATDPDILKKAGVPNAKVVIVATSSDKVNLLISQVVRSSFGDKRIVARANTTSNFSAFTEAGIETMSPVQASVAILENMVLRPSLFKLLATRNSGEEEMIDEFRVRSAKCVGRNLAQLNLQGTLVVALRRDGKLVAPGGSTVLKFDDILTLLGDYKSLERAKRILQVAD